MKWPEQYIVFLDKNLAFTKREVEKFDRLLEEGYDIPEIARKLRRTKLETLLLYIDRLDKKLVDPVFILKRVREL